MQLVQDQSSSVKLDMVSNTNIYIDKNVLSLSLNI